MKLVVDLADGGSIGGLVTRFTWIDDNCEHARRDDRRQLHGSGGRDRDWPHGPSGDSDDLVPGAVVEDALLVLKDGRAFYAKVELED